MTEYKNASFLKILDNATQLGNFEPGSAEWHNLRNDPLTVSGSEVGAILGLSPFKSAITLWAEKCKFIESDIAGSIAMRVGQLVEPAIFQLYCEQHPDQTVETVGTYAHKDFDWAHANPDGIGIDEQGNGFVLEIKHSAIHWDVVPEHYKAQVFWYMWVFDVKRAVFAVLTAGRYKEFEVLWDDFEFAAILDRVSAFRKRVETQVQPDWDGSESTYETIRSLAPGIEDTRTELGTLGIELWNANQAVKKAELYLTEMKSRTIAALNGSKYGTIKGEVVCVLSKKGQGNPYLTIKEKK